MESILEAVGGSQGTPDTPSTVAAGVAADAGDSQASAASDHIHPISTAAPSVPVALGGAAAEGSGAALMRASATLVLASGGATDGQVLVWNAATSAWLPQDVETEDVLTWMDL